MKKTVDGAPKGVAAVDRAVAILRVFDHRTREVDLADIARETGLYKSTILRLMNSLLHARIIKRLESGSYVLDIECGRLGAVYRATHDIDGPINTVLQMLAEETDLTAGYFVRQGEYRVCVAVAVPPHDAFHHIDEGDRLALRQGAAGRLLCAFSGIELEDSEEARHNGYLFRGGDRFPELSSLAAAVVLPGNQLHGVVSLSGRTSLFSDERMPELATRLKAAAQELSNYMQPGRVIG